MGKRIFETPQSARYCLRRLEDPSPLWGFVARLFFALERSYAMAVVKTTKKASKKSANKKATRKGAAGKAPAKGTKAEANAKAKALKARIEKIEARIAKATARAEAIAARIEKWEAKVEALNEKLG